MENMIPPIDGNERGSCSGDDREVRRKSRTIHAYGAKPSDVVCIVCMQYTMVHNSYSLFVLTIAHHGDS